MAAASSPCLTRRRFAAASRSAAAAESSADSAREHAKSQEDLLTGAADVLGVQPEDLPSAVTRFFSEWKDQKKRIEALEAEIEANTIEIVEGVTPEVNDKDFKINTQNKPRIFANSMEIKKETKSFSKSIFTMFRRSKY